MNTISLDLILKLEMKDHGGHAKEEGIPDTPNSASYSFWASLSTGAVHFVPKNMHGAGYVSNWTVSPMAWVVLRTGSFDWIKSWVKGEGESTEYWENQDVGNWVSLILGVANDDKWWMIDDGLSVVGLAVMRLWGDGKSKGCLTLVEVELDTCQDQHPCVSFPWVANSHHHRNPCSIWIPQRFKFSMPL